MSETLRCPFCGGEADIRQADNGKWHISTLRCGNGDISHHAHVIAGTKAEAIAAWNTRAADKPDTFHDDFYDCESTVDAGEDSREKLEADACTFVARAWEAGRNYERRDSNTRCEDVAWSSDELIILLDRQAAITERQGREEWQKAASGEIYQAKQEADELRAKVDEQLCLNALRETTLDYTERLGEASKTLHIETRCTYDDLRVLCKTLMGVFE